MSIDENENQPESDDRAIQVTNCTIYVGRVQIVVDPRLNSDCTIIAGTRATDDHDGSSMNTPPKQDLEPRSQRQPINTLYVTRPKTTKVGPTIQQKSVCQLPANSQLSCCLHRQCHGRCNCEAWFSPGSDNCIARTDNCSAATQTGDPSRRNSSERSPIWGTQNGGRLFPLRLGSRDQNVTKSDWPTPSKIPVLCSGQPQPPARQDRPVDLYAGSRLPVPVRRGPAAARILRIDRAREVRPPSRNGSRNGRRCATVDKPPDTDDKPDDTDDKQNDTEDKPHDMHDYDDTVVEPGQPSMCIDEPAASATSEQGSPLQTLDYRNSTSDSQPVTVESYSLADASDHPSLQHDGQNESGMKVSTLTPVIDDDDDS